MVWAEQEHNGDAIEAANVSRRRSRDRPARGAPPPGRVAPGRQACRQAGRQAGRQAWRGVAQAPSSPARASHSSHSSLERSNGCTVARWRRARAPEDCKTHTPMIPPAPSIQHPLTGCGPDSATCAGTGSSAPSTPIPSGPRCLEPQCSSHAVTRIRGPCLPPLCCSPAAYGAIPDLHIPAPPSRCSTAPWIPPPRLPKRCRCPLPPPLARIPPPRPASLSFPPTSSLQITINNDDVVVVAGHRRSSSVRCPRSVADC